MAPPLTHFLSHNGDWECSVCCEKYDATSIKPWEDADRNLICGNCIRRTFEMALREPIKFPAQWNNQELNATEFADIILDHDFVLEYSTVWLSTMAENAARPRDEASLAGEVPEGLVRGRDYQRCPKCLKGVELKEACNDMKCPFLMCKTGFCYICGKEVSEDEERYHWTVGGCPRYHQPGDAHASYDADEEDVGEIQGNNEDADAMDEIMYRARLSGIRLSDLLQYAWSYAMQNSDERTRRIMIDLLARDVGFRLTVDMEDDIAEVLNELGMYSQVHGVAIREWNYVFRHYLPQARNAMEAHWPINIRRPTDPEPSLGFPVTSGYLDRKVGGVFNILTSDGREQAYSWADSRGIAWRTEQTRQRETEDFAVFDLGPGGTLADRREVTGLITALSRVGHHATGHRVRFDRVWMDGEAILVEVLPAAGAITGGPANPLQPVHGWIFGLDLTGE